MLGDHDRVAAITDLCRAERALERCEALGRISEEPRRLTRRFATPALTEAGDLVLGWMRDGRLKWREDVVDGLRAAPQAFIGLLKGANFGKLVVRVD